jgi:hypothetical protein
MMIRAFVANPGEPVGGKTRVAPHLYVSLDLIKMAETSNVPRPGYFLKMIRYGPIFLRYRPFHSGP